MMEKMTCDSRPSLSTVLYTSNLPERHIKPLREGHVCRIECRDIQALGEGVAEHRRQAGGEMRVIAAEGAVPAQRVNKGVLLLRSV